MMAELYQLGRLVLVLILATGFLAQAGQRASAADRDPAIPLPQAQEELSQVAGVSIRRESESRVPRSFFFSFDGFFFEQTTYSSWGSSLADCLASVAEVSPKLVRGSSLLPGGTYTIKISTTDSGADKVTAKLFRALEEAFDLRISMQKQKSKLLILTKGKNWERDGFKPSWIWGEGLPFHWQAKDALYFFGWDMDTMAHWAEVITGKIVLNETRIQGAYSGSYDTSFRPSGVKKYLAQHGLRLQQAVREVDIVVIEKRR